MSDTTDATGDSSRLEDFHQEVSKLRASGGRANPDRWVFRIGLILTIAGHGLHRGLIHPHRPALRHGGHNPPSRSNHLDLDRVGHFRAQPHVHRPGDDRSQLLQALHALLAGPPRLRVPRADRPGGGQLAAEAPDSELVEQGSEAVRRRVLQPERIVGRHIAPQHGAVHDPHHDGGVAGRGEHLIPGGVARIAP